MSIALRRSRPYSHRLQHLADRLYDQSFASFTGGSPFDGGSTGFQSPPANVWETGDAYLATLMAPGLDEQTINVTVHDDTLAIEGALVVQAPEGATPVWQEFGPSKFRRSLRIGAVVEPSKVEALYRNGLLMITMPKAEHAKPRQVQVQLASTDAK